MFLQIKSIQKYIFIRQQKMIVYTGHARKMAKKMIDQGHQIITSNVEGGHSAAANLK